MNHPIVWKIFLAIALPLIVIAALTFFLKKTGKSIWKDPTFDKKTFISRKPGNVSPLRSGPAPGYSVNYTQSAAISLNGAHDLIIAGKSIAGGSGPAISLYNCSHIRITRNKLFNSSGEGIHLYNCAYITIDDNYFTNVSTGVYAEQSVKGGIAVDHNQFLNMQGPYPRGQCVQFNSIGGPGNLICFNRCENVLGKSNPEDAISLYKSKGTAESPIIIKGNWIKRRRTKPQRRRYYAWRQRWWVPDCRREYTGQSRAVWNRYIRRRPQCNNQQFHLCPKPAIYKRWDICGRV